MTELNDDYDYPINNFGYNGNRDSGIRDRKNEKRRNGGNNRYNNNEDNYRGDSSNNNERHTSNSKHNKNDENYDNYPWKHHDHHDDHHHWGWGHHRFGGYHGSRHRRQAIFQPSALRNVCIRIRRLIEFHLMTQIILFLLCSNVQLNAFSIRLAFCQMDDLIVISH